MEATWRASMTSGFAVTRSEAGKARTNSAVPKIHQTRRFLPLLWAIVAGRSPRNTKLVTMSRSAQSPPAHTIGLPSGKYMGEVQMASSAFPNRNPGRELTACRGDAFT